MRSDNKIIPSFLMANTSLIMIIAAVIWAAFSGDMASNNHRTRTNTTDSQGSTTPQQVTPSLLYFLTFFFFLTYLWCKYSVYIN